MPLVGWDFSCLGMGFQRFILQSSVMVNASVCPIAKLRPQMFDW